MSVSVAHDILPVIRSISSCSSFQDGADYILMPMMNAFQSSYGVVFVFDSSDSGISGVERMIFIGPRRAAEMYRNEHFRADPIRAHPENVPVRLSDCLRTVSEDNGLKKYVSRCLVGNGIGPCIGVRFCVPSAAGLKEIEVSLQRQSADTDYDDRDLQTFQELVPLVKLAISNNILTEELLFLNSARRSRSRASGLSCLDEKERVITSSKYYSLCCCCQTSLISDVHNRRYNGADAKHLLPEFTDREWQVIEALEEGHSNFSLSSALGISVRTVENHLRSIYHKAKVNSRTQLIAKIRLTKTRLPTIIQAHSGGDGQLH